MSLHYLNMIVLVFCLCVCLLYVLLAVHQAFWALWCDVGFPNYIWKSSNIIPLDFFVLHHAFLSLIFWHSRVSVHWHLTNFLIGFYVVSWLPYFCLFTLQLGTFYWAPLQGHHPFLSSVQSIDGTSKTFF